MFTCAEALFGCGAILMPYVICMQCDSLHLCDTVGQPIFFSFFKLLLPGLSLL